MLTQTALPLAGALVLGTWIYLWRWGWMVAADALPVLTVAVVYLTSPWQSHKIAITELNEKQVKWVRLVLGFGFFALGWLKVYNYHLTADPAHLPHRRHHGRRVF
jgi:Flp pilus assembly protein protease CpaA